MPEQTVLEEARGITEELMRLLDVTGTVTPGGDAEGTMLLLASEESGRLIGRKGQTLEALELVMNRILRKNRLEDENLPWVVLDVDGYHVSTPRREEKESSGRHSHLPREEEERLVAMARDIAREVRKIGKSRVIGPFSPSERRVIHVTLENDPDVETVSDEQADENRGKKITVRLREQAAGEENGND